MGFQMLGQCEGTKYPMINLFLSQKNCRPLQTAMVLKSCLFLKKQASKQTKKHFLLSSLCNLTAINHPTSPSKQQSVHSQMQKDVDFLIT